MSPVWGSDALPLWVVDEPAYAEALAPFRGVAVADVAPVAPVTEDTRLLLYFTSGSTGAPKAVTCGQGRVAASGAVMAERFGLGTSDVCYIPMPMFHGNAILANWGPALVAGFGGRSARAVLGFGIPAGRARIPGHVLHLCRPRISYILATPEHPSDAVNSLRAGFGTEAGPLDRERFERRFGCHLWEGYGASEGGINIVAPRTFPQSVQSRGAAVGIGDPTLSIVNLETGDPAHRPNSTPQAAS